MEHLSQHCYTGSLWALTMDILFNSSTSGTVKQCYKQPVKGKQLHLTVIRVLSMIVSVLHSYLGRFTCSKLKAM